MSKEETRRLDRRRRLESDRAYLVASRVKDIGVPNGQRHPQPVLWIEGSRADEGRHERSRFRVLRRPRGWHRGERLVELDTFYVALEHQRAVGRVLSEHR